MSNRFNGFTQDEICVINSKAEPVKRPNSGTVRKHGVIKSNTNGSKISDKFAKSHTKQNDAQIVIQNDATSAKDESNLSESMVQALQDALHYRRLDSNQQSNNPTENFAIEINDRNGNGHGLVQNKENNNYYMVNDDSSSETATARSLFQGISLKDFEKHQQMMKEANLEKRKLLSQAIDQKFEQSIAEATKIAKIREELDKLDQELATDVEILRKEIEAVTLQYTNTRENYHQIEAQFLAAKLNLHQISEKKEMLTEHLCTIITHNEDRKAQKLSELLDKVGLMADCKPSNGKESENNLNNN